MALAALERLKKSNRLIMGATLAPSFYNRSSFFLQVTKTTVNAKMALNIGQIPMSTTELAVLEHL